MKNNIQNKIQEIKKEVELKDYETISKIKTILTEYYEDTGLFIDNITIITSKHSSFKDPDDYAYIDIQLTKSNNII
jgi:hypothetical protein